MISANTALFLLSPIEDREPLVIRLHIGQGRTIEEPATVRYTGHALVFSMIWQGDAVTVLAADVWWYHDSQWLLLTNMKMSAPLLLTRMQTLSVDQPIILTPP